MESEYCNIRIWSWKIIEIQPIADRVAQNFEILNFERVWELISKLRWILKLFQRTRFLLMGFTISKHKEMVNPITKLVCLVLKWKFLEIYHPIPWCWNILTSRYGLRELQCQNMESKDYRNIRQIIEISEYGVRTL